MLKDDEISGEGNSIDFGARIYDPRLGRMRSLDAFASKYPSFSPYAFVANNPISNIEMGGDSVLFYSASGQYLGYSYDNWRYKEKNLLVIIDDNMVNAFNKEYTRKRALKEVDGKKVSASYKEAIVAGLESMGTTYDVTSMKTFFNKYRDKKTDENGKLYTENDDTKQVEWGAKFKTAKNPYYNKNNWRVLDDKTPFNSGMINMVHWDEKNPEGEIHIHTEWLESSPSELDWDRQESINKLYPAAWGVMIDGRRTLFFNLTEDKVNAIIIEKNSFKDGDKNKD